MKSLILKNLKENINSFVSGEELSRRLGVTRAAVWKNIKKLEEEGYKIESVPKNGYKLISCPDILTGDEIDGRLNTKYIGRKICHFSSTDSTNRAAKALAEKGECEGTVVIAEAQTKGRGKVGREWCSKPFAGIWMSVIVRPRCDLSSAILFTLFGCAAVGTAVEGICGPVKIKWPNDVFLGEKKLCGILTETSGETDRADYVILGIGVNVNQSDSDFPKPLHGKATSLKIETGREIKRSDLAANILSAFEALYEDYKKGGNKAVSYCKAHFSAIGKSIRLTRNGRSAKADAVGINDSGQLIVKLEDGTVENISSGDISVLPQGL